VETSTKPPAYLFRYPSISKSYSQKTTSSPIPWRSSHPFQLPGSPFPARRPVRLASFRLRRVGEGLSTDYRRQPQEAFSEIRHFSSQTQQTLVIP
ncbi:hypothetical protein, partial [Paenirhodobacter enshiensis]|uniref:hypothetical protein n=1 Tax=Paenirhodobacter enshiensis TaxID=1105367 RepID=UPI0035B1F401